MPGLRLVFLAGDLERLADGGAFIRGLAVACSAPLGGVERRVSPQE